VTGGADAFAAAERRLFAHYGVVAERRRLRLADPDTTVAVDESGQGEPAPGVCPPTPV
jgi:hypothetical protein